MIYLDTCLVIYAIEDPDGRGVAVRGAIAEHADEDFAISGLVVMECLVGAMRKADDVARQLYERYLSTFVMLTLSQDVFVAAAELRAHHGLRTPDAIHLAAASVNKCSALWTNDGQLAQAAGDFARVVGDASPRPFQGTD
jgi:predicted nucleic acid-binding protein